MHSTYNRVAAQSVERLAALSDGIFAVAMTLLVLDLRVPASDAVHSERDLWHALLALSPRLLIFLMRWDEKVDPRSRMALSYQ
jgi:uncharacterized membrane protein